MDRNFLDWQLRKKWKWFEVFVKAVTVLRVLLITVGSFVCTVVNEDDCILPPTAPKVFVGDRFCAAVSEDGCIPSPTTPLGLLGEDGLGAVVSEDDCLPSAPNIPIPYMFLMNLPDLLGVFLDLLV